MALETCSMCAKLTDSGVVLGNEASDVAAAPTSGTGVPSDASTSTPTRRQRIILCHDCADEHVRRQTPLTTS